MSNPTFPRVVVTGMGLTCALGQNLPACWNAVLSGTHLLREIDLFDVSSCRVRHGFQATLPELDDYSPKALSRLPRVSRLAIPAAREALSQAGLLSADHHTTAPEMALSLSSIGGGMEFGRAYLDRTWRKKRTGRLGYLARLPAYQQTQDLQRALQTTGHAIYTSNSCAGGAHAIGHGADLIRAGFANRVLAGGSESLTEFTFKGFDSLQALSPDRCRPFDENRTGLLLGEGAAFVVLEALDKAKERGATILAELSGFGHATDLAHLTQPSPNGEALARCMTSAAQQAQVASEAIDYVNAHGTGTPLNDIAEATSYVTFFGDKVGGTAISSTKALTGHTLGAAGAIEAVIAIKALVEGALPPQWNCESPLDAIASSLVKRTSTPSPSSIRHVMSVNLGFGGSNAALIFSRYEA